MITIKPMFFILLYQIIIQSEWLRPDNLTDDSKLIYDRMKDLATCPVCLDMLKDPVACTECAGTVCRACRNDNS